MSRALPFFSLGVKKSVSDRYSLAVRYQIVHTISTFVRKSREKKCFVPKLNRLSASFVQTQSSDNFSAPFSYFSGGQSAVRAQPKQQPRHPTSLLAIQTLFDPEHDDGSQADLPLQAIPHHRVGLQLRVQLRSDLVSFGPCVYCA